MSDPPDWAVSLARALVVAHYNSTDYEATDAIARAIADTVDAARVETAEAVRGACCRDKVEALRWKEPKR